MTIETSWLRALAQGTAGTLTMALLCTQALAQQPAPDAPPPPQPAPKADDANPVMVPLDEEQPQPAAVAPAEPKKAPARRPTGPTTPTDEQSKLLREGAMANKLGDHAKAAKALRAALDIGNLNVARLQLAKALLGQGQCDDASAELARAMTAPPVINPPVSQVLTDIAALRTDLAARCPAMVTVTCSTPQMEVFVDGLGPLPCDGQPIMLLPGDHTISGKDQNEEYSQDFNLGIMGRKVIELGPAADDTVMEPLGVVDPVPEPPPLPPEEPLEPEEPIANLDPMDAVEPPGPVETGGPTIEETPKPPEPIKKWMLGARIGAIVNGETTVDREAFDFFDSQSGQDQSGFQVELMAGYRFSRRYPIHFGVKANITPEYQLDIDSENLSPSGTAFDVNLFAQYTRPFGKRSALFLSAEVGPTFLELDNAEIQTEGNQMSGINGSLTGGLRWGFNDRIGLVAALRLQGYSLSNEANLTVDQESIAMDVSGSRALLTFGVEFVR